jgi:hypothetical protein
LLAEATVVEDRNSTQPCGDDDHRVVWLHIPRAKAAMVRARLIDTLGADQVSRLGKFEAGWRMIICPKCANWHKERAG